MAALYDGNDNRTFMMEYTPELQRQDSLGGNRAEEETSRNRRNRSGEAFSDSIKEDAGEKEGLSIGSGGESQTGDERISAEEEPSGTKAFWYGALCQMEDIFLPAPTPFKAWLHEKMGLTDDISVLWREEVYEADLGAGSLSVQEAGNPFVLMESVFADTTGESLSSDAYRQVSYVNDINRVNVQAVMEYTVNGGMGESVTSYSFGMQRESYTMTLSGLSAGAGETALRVEGTYYYTGTGSVSNLTDGKGNGRSYAYALSGEAYSFAMYKGEDEIISVTAGTYSAYAYNGEYTHQSIGLQYLRARYLSLETGTFTSRDSYGGRVWDILSQNRYTYAENNPVTYGDPSGHAKAVKGIGSMVGSKVTSALSNLKTSLVPAVTKKSTSVPLSVGATNGAGITTTTKNLPLSVGAANGAGIVSTPNKLPSLLDNIRIYNGDEYYNNLITRVPIQVLMSTSGGGMSYEESVAAKIEAARCRAYNYCENDEQKAIGSIRTDFNAIEVYGAALARYDWLSAEEQISNAEYIFNYLLKEGWTIEAICGLLGNISVESHFNPGTNQKTLAETKGTGNGYGIVQWDAPEDKFLKWIKLSKTEANKMAQDNPKQLLDKELQYLLESSIGEGATGDKVEKEWYVNWGANTAWGDNTMYYSEYIVSTSNPKNLAISFCQSYERTDKHYEERQEWAEEWYKYFLGISDIREYFENGGF